LRGWIAWGLRCNGTRMTRIFWWMAGMVINPPVAGQFD